MATTPKKLDPNIRYLKIHGLQRSGTNFLAHLINQNFQNTEVLVNLGGWKHGPYMLNHILGDEEIDVIIITKNPYAWLVSVYEYWKNNEIGPNLKDIPFNQFLKNRAVFEPQKNVPYLFRAANPIQYWNNMYYHWASIKLKQKQSCVITYESIIEDPYKALSDIAVCYDLKPHSWDFNVIEEELMPSGEQIKASNNKWNKRDYYLSKKYLSYYDEDSLKYVNQNLDREVMNVFKYTMEHVYDEYQNALNISNELISKMEFQEALNIIDGMIKKFPEKWIGYFNYGSVLVKVGRHTEALEYFDKCKELGCKEPGMLAYNEGVAYRGLEQLDKSIVKYREAISHNFNVVACNNNIAISQITAGKYKEGFEQWEWRFQANPKYMTLRKRFDKPDWPGKKGKKRVLVFNEQGRGDMLQFCRYFPMMKEKGAYVIVSTRSELIELMKNVEGVDEVIRRQDVPEDYDYAISVNSLPRIFKTSSIKDIPCKMPYLKPNGSSKVDESFWKPYENKFKIGFCWAGSTSHPYDHMRSIKNSYFKQLTSKDIQMFSLQKKKRDQDHLLLDDSFYIDMDEYFDDFNDLSHILLKMDLVISVDTGVVHLSGGLGHPTWVIVTKPGCFRWLLDRTDSPWYPYTKLFRQDDLESTFNNINKELKILMSK